MKLNSSPVRIFWANVLVLSAATMIAAGCGGGAPKKVVGTVDGTVTFDGKPVEAGTVYLELKGGGGGTASPIGPGGKFSIVDVPAGTYVVTVMPVELTPDDVADGKTAPPSDNIPEMYRSSQTSDLTAEIKEGANTITVEMKPH